MMILDGIKLALETEKGRIKTQHVPLLDQLIFLQHMTEKLNGQPHWQKINLPANSPLSHRQRELSPLNSEYIFFGLPSS